MKNLLLILFIAFNLIVYSQSPNYEWAVQSTGLSREFLDDLETDINGNVYVVGEFKGISMKLGNITLTNSDLSGNTYDIFVAKYSNQGTIIWVKRFGSIGSEKGTAININENGSIFVTGAFFSVNFDVGGINLANTDNQGLTQDIFLINLSNNGDVLWVKSAIGIDSDYSNSVASNNSSVTVFGAFGSSSLSFNDTTLTNSLGESGNSDIFLANYDLNGNLNWAKKFGEVNGDLARGIAYDSIGNLIITGSFGFNIYFDAIHLTGGHGYFVSKLSSNGNVIWAYGSGSYIEPHDLSLDRNQNIIITGMHYPESGNWGLNNIDSTHLVNQGGRDFFAAKFSPEGAPLWVKQSGSIDHEEGISISTDIFDNVFISGYFYGDSIIFEGTTIYGNGSPNLINTFLIKYNSEGVFQLGINPLTSPSYTLYSYIDNDQDGNLYIGGAFNAPSITFGSNTLTNSTTDGSNELDFFLTKMSNVSGVTELNSTTELTIFPNPSNGIFNLNLEKELDFKVKVYDVFGRLIYSDNSQKIAINLENQEKGIYFVEIETSKESYSQKIILE